jgi:hypothetical protein
MRNESFIPEEKDENCWQVIGSSFSVLRTFAGAERKSWRQQYGSSE